MSDWEHVDKEEIIISEDGLNEAIHNAYLKGRNDVLEKISAEIDNINLNEVATKYEDKFYGFQREVIKMIDKYRESEEY